MSEPSTVKIKQGSNFTLADYGPPAQWKDIRMNHPRLGEVRGKTFLREPLGLTGSEVSLGSLAPGAGVPFLHAHKQNEELYLFIGGAGEMQVDGAVIPVSAGSAVRIAPAGVRCLRNTGGDPLLYAVIQAKAGSLEQATGGDGIVPDQPVKW
jgi:uncharacterized cupin superfamily protein